MEWYHKHNLPLLVFKVHFKKDYDSLRWDYMDLIMYDWGLVIKGGDRLKLLL